MIEVPDDVAVASVVATGSVHAGDVPGPPDDATARELDAILPGASATPVRLAGAQSDWPDLRLPVVADEALLDAIGAPEQVRDLLDEVGLVEFGPAEELGGVQITPVDSGIAPEPGAGVTDRQATDRQATLPDGTMQPIGHGGEGFMVGGGPWNLVDPELVDDLGVDPVMGAVVYRTPDPLTDRQLDDLDALRSDWYLMQPPGTGGHLDISARWNETDGPTPVQVELVLTGVALVLSVLVVGASLALAAAESRDERDVLTVVGASPGALARASGIRALLLSATGAAMAVPAGLLPVAVAVAADNGSLRFVVPWRTIGLLVVALPVVAGVVALVVGSAGQRLRPVRFSTARFE